MGVCEREAENYSAGTSLVIISYPRSPLPKYIYFLPQVPLPGTEEAELGLLRFAALIFIK